jgi:hypothetical protein
MKTKGAKQLWYFDICTTRERVAPRICEERAVAHASSCSIRAVDAVATRVVCATNAACVAARAALSREATRTTLVDAHANRSLARSCRVVARATAVVKERGLH